MQGREDLRLPSRSRGLWHACTIRPEFDPMHRSNGVEGIESVCVCGVEIGSWHGRLQGLVVHVYTQGCVRSVCKSSLFAARLFALSPPLPPPPRPTPPPPSSTILHTHTYTPSSLSPRFRRLSARPRAKASACVRVCVSVRAWF